MIHALKSMLWLLLLANVAVCAQNSKSNYWQCSTRDNTNLVWTAKSPYQKTALNLAYDACKKQSSSPVSCKTSKSACEAFIQGVSTRPLWRCVALDREALAWKSNYYSNRIDAALAANAYCKDNSAVPETCYINLVTCANLNEGVSL